MEFIGDAQFTSLNKEQDKDRLLTVKEVAHYLQISEKTVYKWSSQGRIPIVKLSRKCVRFDRVQVRRWREAMSQKGRLTKRVEAA